MHECELVKGTELLGELARREVHKTTMEEYVFGDGDVDDEDDDDDDAGQGRAV